MLGHFEVMHAMYSEIKYRMVGQVKGALQMAYCDRVSYFKQTSGTIQTLKGNKKTPA